MTTCEVVIYGRTHGVDCGTVFHLSCVTIYKYWLMPRSTLKNYAPKLCNAAALNIRFSVWCGRKWVVIQCGMSLFSTVLYFYIGYTWANYIRLLPQTVTQRRQFMRKCCKQRCASTTAKSLMQCVCGCKSIHISINNGFNHGFNWSFR